MSGKMTRKELLQTVPDAKTIDAIVPCTMESGGEGTRILLTSGAVRLYGSAIQTIARVYAAREDKEFGRVGRSCASLLGKSHGTIYPISLDLTLVGLKVRTKGYSSHRSTMAYVNIAHPLSVRSDMQSHLHGMLVFRSGKSLTALWSAQTVWQKLDQARYIYLRTFAAARDQMTRAERTLPEILRGTNNITVNAAQEEN